MVSANVNRIPQQAQSLTLEERQQFIELLRAQPMPKQSTSPEEQITLRLLEKGIIRKIPAKPTADEIASFAGWKPVNVEGRPVSEVLIEERNSPKTTTIHKLTRGGGI